MAFACFKWTAKQGLRAHERRDEHQRAGRLFSTVQACDGRSARACIQRIEHESRMFTVTSLEWLAGHFHQSLCEIVGIYPDDRTDFEIIGAAGIRLNVRFEPGCVDAGAGDIDRMRAWRTIHKNESTRRKSADRLAIDLDAYGWVSQDAGDSIGVPNEVETRLASVARLILWFERHSVGCDARGQQHRKTDRCGKIGKSCPAESVSHQNVSPHSWFLPK
jgi:hypothetical protein